MFLGCMLTLLLAGGVLLTPAQTRKRPAGRSTAKLDGKGGDITSGKRRVGAQVKPGQTGGQITRPGGLSQEGAKTTTPAKGPGLSDSRGDDTIKPGATPSAKVRDGTSNTVAPPGAGQGNVNPARRAGPTPRVRK